MNDYNNNNNNHNNNHVFFFTYATDLSHPFLINIKKDFPDIKILENLSMRHYNSNKIISLLSNLSRNDNFINDDDYVIFLDGYDIFPCKKFQNQKELVDIFLTYKSPIVFGAEKNVFPPKWKKNYQYLYQQQPLFLSFPMRYLNSGFFMGKKKDIMLMLSTIFEKHYDNKMQRLQSISDQDLFTEYFFNNLDKVVLDIHSHLVLNCHDVSLENVMDMHNKKKTFFLHFNGGSKKYMKNFHILLQK